VNIGILGVGSIGATLTRRLSAAGHDVVVANSRGPETIPGEVLIAGGRAVHAAELVTDALDVLITSVPLNRTPDIAPLVGALRPDAVLVDTSNYYPHRDGHVAALDDGQVESDWVSEQLGRRVVKAWNAIYTDSFAHKSTAAGVVGRIAVPVAGDTAEGRALGVRLVEDTGFDGYDAGPLSESWRQQPGTPAYCTDLTLEELPHALASAVAARSPRRRDLATAVIAEKRRQPTTGFDGDFLVELNRLLYR
jgi:predicted dinucleotide-binding enzyme